MITQLIDERYDHKLRQCFTEQLAEHPIYSNNLLASRSGALQNHFPLLKARLGDNIFSSLAQVYAQHFPSKNWDINVYGEGFAEFIEAQQNSGLGDDYPWLDLALIAAIEYQLLCLYYDDSEVEVTYRSMTMPRQINTDLFIDGLGQLPIHHPWVSIDIASMQNVSTQAIIGLHLKRQINEQGFCISVHADATDTLNELS